MDEEALLRRRGYLIPRCCAVVCLAFDFFEDDHPPPRIPCLDDIVAGAGATAYIRVALHLADRRERAGCWQWRRCLQARRRRAEHGPRADEAIRVREHLVPGLAPLVRRTVHLRVPGERDPGAPARDLLAVRVRCIEERCAFEEITDADHRWHFRREALEIFAVRPAHRGLEVNREV